MARTLQQNLRSDEVEPRSVTPVQQQVRQTLLGANPLPNSPEGLKDSAMEYAKELLNTCLDGPPKHAKGNPWGENIARNRGNPTSWGRLMPPEGIVGRFVDREVGLPWAKNGHLTNVLWRASKYVGEYPRPGLKVPSVLLTTHTLVLSSSQVVQKQKHFTLFPMGQRMHVGPKFAATPSPAIATW